MVPDKDVILSGKTTFRTEVSYKIFETGTKNSKKPLIIYLHGFGQNISTFQQKCNLLFQVEAYHLYIQGPYPLYERAGKRKVADWGRLWYLYDGTQDQFIRSMEHSSEFIQNVVDNLLKLLPVNRLCILGYSMGGYLAGYFTLTRWKHINDLIVAGARIKTEILHDDWQHVGHLHVLAVHGKKDNKVKYTPQKKEILKLKEHGAKAELKLLNESHSFTDSYAVAILKWLLAHQYKKVKK